MHAIRSEERRVVDVSKKQRHIRTRLQCTRTIPIRVLRGHDDVALICTFVIQRPTVCVDHKLHDETIGINAHAGTRASKSVSGARRR